MIALGLDASAGSLAVGLLRDGEPVADVRLWARQGHSRLLVRVVRDVLRDAGVPPRGLDLVAVAAGPGSYTGVRLAATAAKVLAWAAGARVVGVDGLQARAAAAAAAGAGSPLAAVLPARRDELYGRLYLPGWPPVPAGPLHEGPAADVIARLVAEARRAAGEAPLFFGEGVAEDPGRVTAAGGRLPGDPALHMPLGVLVARLGLEAAGEGGGEDPIAFLPRYVGPPPAREPRGTAGPLPAGDR